MTKGVETRQRPTGVMASDEAQPAAWLHEFTDPHDGTRRRATWMHKPRDSDLQPGDTVTPLYAASGVSGLHSETFSPKTPMGENRG